MPVINQTNVFKATVVETFSEDEVPSAASRDLTHSRFDSITTLNATSTPAGTKLYTKELTGNQSLDFTALVKDIGGTIDCSGLKLQSILLNNTSSSNLVTWADGAANGYSVNGGSDKVIQPGGKWHEFFNDQLADVAAGVKAIDITATDTYQIVLVFG